MLDRYLTFIPIEVSHVSKIANNIVKAHLKKVSLKHGAPNGGALRYDPWLTGRLEDR